jgi:hypothetical protein
MQQKKKLPTIRKSADNIKETSENITMLHIPKILFSRYQLISNHTLVNKHILAQFLGTIAAIVARCTA